ncbi:hypothetical protein CASFOL_025667 [Castilleja foliolosa]|uniref:F-box domain-containing protein n=1 Tax=Castilleja foliolosa TaxID=1961234 RepID=A0ABD3CRR5_9LAMI
MAIQNVTSPNILGDDIMQVILSRLPVKSLVRFRAVSKSWNTIISNPRFASLHFEQSKVSSDILFVQRIDHNKNVFYPVRFENRKLHFEASRLEVNTRWGCKIAVSCTCEGVVLLTDDSNARYTLWNPSTQTKTEFLCPYTFQHSTRNWLCYDPITDDFKVVVVSWGSYTVYSCKNKSWSPKGKRVPYCLRGRSTSSLGVSADGAVYWVADSKNITWFDPRDDEFKTLQKPEYVKDKDGFNLVCLRGRLCLYCNVRDQETAVKIWKKDKGLDASCWEELVKIEIKNEKQMPIVSFKPLCLVENNNKILIRVEGARYGVYSPCEKTFEELSEDCSFDSLVPFEQSLYFFPTRSLGLSYQY